MYCTIEMEYRRPIFRGFTGASQMLGAALAESG